MKKPMAEPMASLMFLGIIRTIKSRMPKTDSPRKMRPETRMTAMICPKEMLPDWSSAPSMKLLPMPVERAKGMLA